MKKLHPSGTTELAFRVSVASWTVIGMLMVRLFSASPSLFSDARTTALAVLALLLSLLALDDALFEGRTPAMAAGFPFGLALGFFVEQVNVATVIGRPSLAQGAERTLLVVFAVSVGIRLWRIYRKRRAAADQSV